MNIIIKSGSDGALVRVVDVGSAELGAETYSTALRFQGVEAIGFAVTALPTANALDVQRGVTDEMARLSSAFPPGLRYQVAFDTTTVVQESIREVVKTIAEALGLVVLVMFLFLQSWRATLIPARIRARICSSLELAGPIVQTILVPAICPPVPPSRDCHILYMVIEAGL